MFSTSYQVSLDLVAIDLIPTASLFVHWKMPKLLARATAMYFKCLSRVCFQNLCLFGTVLCI